jgi:hypothetical protein
MKTLTVRGDPHSLTAVVVPKTEEFHDHDIVRINSSDSDKTTEKKIFRIVDAGDDHWELQFE